MGVEIKIPEVGESVTSGVIAAWVKKDGDYVERDETVLELETDKITMEVPAPAAGVLSTSASEGDEVDVGAVVGQIDDSASKPGEGSGESTKAAESSEPAKPAAPTATAAPAQANGASGKSAAKDTAAKESSGEVHATPLARKLAEEKGVDLSSIKGTGPGNRVREQDVLAAMKAKPEPKPEPKAETKTESKVAAPAPAGDRSVTRERMSPLRQRVAARLVEAQQTAAMLTTFNEVDMSAVMDLRKRYKDSFSEKHGVNLGFMSFFVKACVSALKAFPKVNAFIVEDENGSPAIEKHAYQDIAIAVSGPKGLVVPVLRDCAGLSFAGIESGIKDLAVRARDGKLGLEELTGGTFTITNGGIFGSMMSTPILNPPQSAILGMHAIKNRAVEDPAHPGQIVLHPMMYLALSYDHRIVDGAEAVSFLVHVKDAIEDPSRLMLEL